MDDACVRASARPFYSAEKRKNKSWIPGGSYLISMVWCVRKKVKRTNNGTVRS